MQTSVLQPARRRRRRIVRRRAAPLVLLGGAAVAFGIAAAVHRGGSGPEPAAAAGKPAPKRQPAASAPARLHPLALLHGPATLHAALRVTAPAAILVDRRTGRVLWAKRAHQRRQVASTTKIMTAMLALRRLAPDDVVTVDRSVPRVPLVREGLRAGERVQAWKLFHGLLLYSGNDDALALAIAAAGSRPAFVHAMNAEALRLNLRDTHFRSPSGVEDVDNYSSAWDLAALTRVAMRDARFRAIVRTKRRQVPWAAPTYSKIYVNKNLMLTRYPGADGVKTGYTSRAGHCLVASATRHGRSLIAVVLDSRDMYGDATKLLDRGFGAV
jgi:D-alanyl-D-alanine carboxypeptidase (penicillin-binding protein 5/6)